MSLSVSIFRRVSISSSDGFLLPSDFRALFTDKDKFIALTFLPLNKPRETGAAWDPQKDVDESMVPITLHLTPEYAKTFAKILDESVKDADKIFKE